MPTIDANGLTVFYEVAGSGPPLIMLHGASTDAQTQFGDLQPVLARATTAYAPDARGHGATRFDVARGLDTRDLVHDVIAFADALHLPTFHLLGYSMGAMTALHVTAHHPARVRTLAVISAAPEREPRLAVARSLFDADRIERNEPAWAAALAARHDQAQGHGAWRSLVAAIVDDVAQQPLLTAADLRGISAPTLVVAGDRDPVVPVDQAWRLSRQVRSGRLLILPGVGHDALDGGSGLLRQALADIYMPHDGREDLR